MPRSEAVRKALARQGSFLQRVHAACVALVLDRDIHLTVRQMAILLVCAGDDEPPTLHALSVRLDIAKPVASRALDRLEALNFVRRRYTGIQTGQMHVEIQPPGFAYLARLDRTRPNAEASAAD